MPITEMNSQYIIKIHDIILMLRVLFWISYYKCLKFWVRGKGLISLTNTLFFRL